MTVNVLLFASYADSLGTIEGTISSTTGAALSGAHVAVSCKSVNRMVQTDASGHFSVSGLPEGTCRVSAALAGYKAAATNVGVKAGGTMSIKLALATAPKDAKKLEEKPADKTVMPKPD